MTEDPGGELAEKIDVFVAVEIPQSRPLAAHHRQRKRVDMNRRAGVAARHRLTSRLVLHKALRVALPVRLFRLAKRSRDIDVGGMNRRHRCLSASAEPRW